MKSGTPTVIAPGVGESAHHFAALRDLEVARSEAHGTHGIFDFHSCADLLIPSTLPLKDGYYTVDAATGVCLGKPPCRDYLHRGACTHKCKHGWAAVVTHATEVVQREWKMKLFNLLKNRERSSLPCQRNLVLYEGTEDEVILALKSGAKSFHRSSVQQEQGGQEVQLFLRVDSAFDLVQRVTLTQFDPAQHEDASVEVLPTTPNSSCHVVTVIHGSESMAYFRKCGLFDAAGELLKGRYLGVHDIIVGFNLEDLNADIASDPIVLQVLQAQAGRRENVSARTHFLSTVRVPGLKRRAVGGGREYRRKEKTSKQTADSATPYNLKQVLPGRQHKHKPLATAKKKKSFHDNEFVLPELVSSRPNGAGAEAGNESHDDVYSQVSLIFTSGTTLMLTSGTPLTVTSAQLRQ